jgi:hypothetical protein
MEECPRHRLTDRPHNPLKIILRKIEILEGALGDTIAHLWDL